MTLRLRSVIWTRPPALGQAYFAAAAEIAGFHGAFAICVFEHVTGRLAWRLEYRDDPPDPWAGFDRPPMIPGRLQ